MTPSRPTTTTDSRNHTGTRVRAPREVDRNGLEILEREECLQLLRDHSFGRVGVTFGALPTILPVTYRMIDDRVVFQTGVGQKLTAATAGSVIVFEIDAMDAVNQSGWSVVLTAVANVVDDAEELKQLRILGIPDWLPSTATQTVALDSHMVSGRRLRPW